MKKKKEVVILPKEEKVHPKPEPSTNKNDVSAKEALEILSDQPEGKESDKPSATQKIPDVVEKVKKPELTADEIAEGEFTQSPSLENELAFGNFDDKRSIKIKIDPDTIKAPAYAVEDFRGFFEKFQKEKDAKPNILFINTMSLEKLGYRDVAVDLGLSIKESTVYKENELVLALDL